MKKKILVTVLTLIGTSAAMAQNMTIYEIVDTGIEFLNHSGPKDSNLVRMPMRP